MTTIGLKTSKLLDYLDEILPNASCELNYSKDYELLLAVMLSAQTTDKKVNQVTKILFDKYPNLETLKQADIKDLEKIIYPIGTYTKKAKNIKNIALKISEVGYVPNDRTFLESLSGVGRKTTNVVLSILYNEPYLAVDTHILRIAKRLGYVKDNATPLIVEKKLTKYIPANRISKTHHQLIHFGRYYCKAINPLCDNCKLKDICKK